MARDGDAGGAAGQVAAGGEVPVSDATRSLVASPGGGVPIPDAVRARIEPHLGADLSGVQVHTGGTATAAAAELQARAFTVGAHIFLGEGQSVGDLELMGHEATHVVQQVALDTWRAPVARDLEVSDLLPDFVVDGVTSAVQAIPGYALVGLITGKDPLTDEPVRPPDLELVEKVLTWGPFGAAVGPVLQGVEVLADIVAYLRERMAAHDLTWDRISGDIGRAWDEMGVTEGISGNVAIVERYVDAFLADVRALVEEVKDAVIAKVREVVATIAEPLLQRPEIAPLWNLAVKAFHHNPLTGEDVDAPTVEVLGDFLRFIGKGTVVDQMTERGTLQETADWLDTMWGRFTGLLGQAGALFSDAWDAISPANLPRLLDTLPVLADRAFALVSDVGAFAWDVVAKVLELVKKSLLGWLSEHAHAIPGFHLMTVILEKNPFTDERVPRTAENLIKGFITLLPGGDQMYSQLAESGAIAQAGARVDGAVESLGISWELITSTFKGVWDLVTLEKLLSPIDTFNEITAKFGEPLGRIFEFIAIVVETVIELILRMMNFPPELVGNVVSNATAAIDDIVADPVGFLLNLIGAMKAGFSSFFGKIGTYLLNGLADWLFRGLTKLGVERPTELTLEAAIKLVVQLSGITVEVIWQKLAVHLGQETVDRIRGAVAMAGEAFAFVQEVQEGGFSAIWARLTEKLSMLWDTLFDMVKDWIMSEIVDAAIAKVLSMLDPTGIMAVINGAIAFFRAVQSVLDYVRELLEIVDSYVATIGAIAKGDVGPGAAMLEGGLAAAVPVAIGFLANQVGLGDAPEKIAEFVVGLREKLFEALDWLIERAVALGRGALAALTGEGGADGAEGGPEPAAADFEDVPVDETVHAPDGDHHLRDDGTAHALVLHSTPVPLSAMERAGEPLAPLLTAFDTAKQEFVAARTTWRAWLDAGRPAPRPTANLGGTRARLVTALNALVAYAGGGRPGYPRASAPNIGDTAKHGSQPPRIRGPEHASVRSEDPIWQQESEHVLPFGTGRQLWTALTASAPERGEWQDMSQTTVVLYFGAARIKTPADNELTEQAKTAGTAAATQFGDVLKALAINPDNSGALERAQSLTVAYMNALRPAANAAMNRTVDAIREENAQVAAGFTDTNGVRRGPEGAGEQPVPSSGVVGGAVATQLGEVEDMAETALQGVLERLLVDDTARRRG
ncbi:DUF4157 domain-containing protein [Cellulomonas sp. Sa3CUA2]|uniref:DUF4157 domain-containing protein n=1 Tax=Cellulomonas avistercoris TaxID=2762242 RepID=A0ABR8QDS7_9CELL|nr:DUF4157 domain-containing protein [Cellulomonas avistercoris]MBD7918577.1 DUF4157 domain-containing protein [Cellulomonas avistercoris]